MIRSSLITIALVLFGCTGKEALTDARFAVGQAGALLVEYKTATEDEILTEAKVEAGKCAPHDVPCIFAAVDTTIAKYRDRETKYNRLAFVQNSAQKALQEASTVCNTPDNTTCESATARALVFVPELVALVKEVQSWR